MIHISLHTALLFYSFYSICILFVELQILLLHFEMLDMLDTSHGHIHFIASLMYMMR